MPNNTVSIQECRTLLGAAAEGKSDAQVEALRDELTGLANVMYDIMATQSTDRIRWSAYMHENTDDERGY